MVKISKKNRAFGLNFRLYLNNVLYFFTGLIAFSSVSFYLTRVKIGLPFYLPELLLFPLFLFKIKVIIKYIKIFLSGLLFDASLIIEIVVWVLLVFLGYIFTQDMFSVLSSARPILYIIIVAYLSSKVDSIKYNFIFYICLGAVFGELIHSIYFAQTYFAYDYSYKDIHSVNIIATFLCISIPIIYKKTQLQITSALLISALVIISGFRIVLISAVLAFFISHLYVIKYDRRGKILKTFALILTFVTVIFFTNYYINTYGISQYRNFRLVSRTMNLLKGDIVKSQDLNRLDKVKLVYKDFFSERFFPRGFITRGYDLVGLHNDIPVIFFYDTIGSLATIILLYWFFKKGYRFLRSKLRYPDFNIDTVIAISFLLLILLFFTNGRFLYIVYESWLAAILIGRLARHNIVLIGAC